MNSALKLQEFIKDKETLKPVTPKDLFKSKAIRDRGWDGSQISMISFAVLGAVFRDGGMYAVKRLLEKKNIILKSEKVPKKIFGIGLEASKLLFLNAICSIDSSLTAGAYYLSNLS